MHRLEGLFPYLILDGERADLPSLSALALRRRQAGVVDSLVVAHIASRQRYQSSVYALLPLLCVLLRRAAFLTFPDQVYCLTSTVVHAVCLASHRTRVVPWHQPLTICALCKA